MPQDLIQNKEQQILGYFASAKNWEERYRTLIQLGKELAEMPEELKTEDRKVKGCQSQVWLEAQLDGEGRVRLLADSDAMIVKGLVRLLVEYYSGLTPQQVMQQNPNFIGELGLQSHLSPSRANGLNAMLKQIKIYGLAFSVKR